MDNCPHMILKQSIKVALQQPSGVKLKMERFIENFENDEILLFLGILNFNFSF